MQNFYIALREHHMSVGVIFSTQINWLFYDKSYLKRLSSQTDVNYEMVDKFYPYSRWIDE